MSKIALRRFLPVALMAAGLLLLLYVGSQYAQMYLQQRRLAREWEQQQHRPVAASSEGQSQNDGLTRLSIPKINLNAIVVEGTSRHDLLIGPGHIKKTAAPGAAGNSVITAHRDTFFRNIYELNKGDIVSVEREGHTYHYEVTGKKIVDPEDTSVIQETNDKRLTLITCYPTYFVGPAPERLVVFAKLVENAAVSPVAQTASGTPVSVKAATAAK